ncbi:MAG: hypothetical protein AAFO04_03740 [Cyanobacteria bacterium J06592_8]
MKRIAIATLLLTSYLALPAVASVDARRVTHGYSVENTGQTESLLLADSRVDRAWRDYRDQRHRVLDRQMNDEMNRPHNARLSQRQKEKVIRDAHKALDKQLDREEKEWKRRYSGYDDRNDRYDRDYDRNNRRNDRRYDRNNRRNDRRYDRSRSDRYYRVDPQNPYEQYRRTRSY